MQGLDEGVGAVAGRVEQDFIEAPPCGDGVPGGVEQVSANKSGALREMVASGVFGGTLGQGRGAFDADYFGTAGGNRQAEVAEAAKQVGDAFSWLGLQQVQGAADHQRVGFGIDLGKVAGAVR